MFFHVACLFITIKYLCKPKQEFLQKFLKPKQKYLHIFSAKNHEKISFHKLERVLKHDTTIKNIYISIKTFLLERNKRLFIIYKRFCSCIPLKSECFSTKFPKQEFLNHIVSYSILQYHMKSKIIPQCPTLPHGIN